MRFQSALTIGATGMLRGALDHICSEANQVLSVSRHTHALPAHARAATLDYADPIKFMAALNEECDLSKIDLAVLWMHDNGNKAAMALLEALSEQPCLIIHVAGSAAGNPDRQFKKVTSRVPFGPTTNYCPVILGNMPSDEGTRWLTHEEISQGAIGAIKTQTPQMVGNRLH